MLLLYLQWYLSRSPELSCPTVLLIIFTNPVLPETSTFSSKSLGIIFNSSFLKHQNNQSTIPVSTFEMHLDSDHCSLHPPKLQAEPPLCCSWFTVLASYFVSLFQSLSPTAFSQYTGRVRCC